MTAIDSPSNPHVAAARRALQNGERIPIEGARLLREALDSGIRPGIVFHTAGSLDDDLAARVEGAAVVVSNRVLEKLSELASARGVVAIAPLPVARLADLPRLHLAVVLDGIQDPSNVGAILRSAEAFGAEAALLTEGCASPFSAKALRASAGSAFRLPVVTGLGPGAVVAWAREHGVTLAGAEARDGDPPEAVRHRPLALVIGSEGQGISTALQAALDFRVTIRLSSRVESLNAAVAASVVLYAITHP